MEQQLFKHSATGTVRTSQVEHSPGNGAVGACLTFTPFKLLPYCGCGARRNVGAQDPCTSDQWVFQQSDIYRGDKCPLWDNLINLPRACMCCTCRCTIGSCCPFFQFSLRGYYMENTISNSLEPHNQLLGPLCLPCFYIKLKHDRTTVEVNWCQQCPLLSSSAETCT